MTAIGNLRDGFFDYAGLFPPANLELETALENYGSYRRGKDARALGRFIVDLDRVKALLEAAGDDFQDLRLSVVAAANANWDTLRCLLDHGAPIESIEIKPAAPSVIASIAARLPAGLATWFEVPFDASHTAALDAICTAGANAKLRMGGVVAEAFPSTRCVAGVLQAIADRHLSFKATAGLHHPLRSRHAFTSSPASTTGMMHGFVNLCCAATLIHLGGDADDATAVLEETDPRSWSVTPDSIGWRGVTWGGEEIRAARQEFFVSIGSCSFVEPMADLEALGWR
ncbi:MAG TPA: hypothetical protein VL967_04550 [Terracidiphilus sp.]|nr:hypothetical protein [Terracidiphilus sp.]